MSLFKPEIAKAAANWRGLTDQFGTEVYGTPAGNGNLFQVLGTLFDVLVSILGVVLFFMIFVAGFYWMTAGGDSGQVDKAKTLITNAIAGLVLVLLALAISQFVQSTLIDNLSSVAPSTPIEQGGGGSDDGSCPPGSSTC